MKGNPFRGFDRSFIGILCAVTTLYILLAIRYQFYLVNYLSFGDEAETIVTAKMITSGMTLYSEIFNHHGPLTFLPGLITEMFGDIGVSGHRVSIVLLQVLALVSLYTSPVLGDHLHRIFATVCSATMMLVFMPEIFGHMYLYQTMVGLFLVIILSQYTLPAILMPGRLSTVSTIAGNALIASLPFLAITYAPISVLLFAASLRGQHVAAAEIGALAGVVGNLAFLGMVGSFSGYLAYHIYLNLNVLPFYGARPDSSLLINAIKTMTSDLGYILALAIMLLSAFVLTRKDVRLPWRTLALMVGFVSLLVRGGGFQGIPFFYAMLPMFALSLTLVDLSSSAARAVAIGVISLCTLKISLLLPGDESQLTSHIIPKKTEFSQLVSRMTEPGDRIIAYSFRNIEYILSHRLPASGNFFYLPWQEKYNEAPRFGIVIDTCKQIRDAAPKIMMIDKWKVWRLFTWESYAECVQKIIDSDYRQVPGKPFYIRKDLWDQYAKTIAPSSDKTAPTQPTD